MILYQPVSVNENNVALHRDMLMLCLGKLHPEGAWFSRKDSEGNDVSPSLIVGFTFGDIFVGYQMDAWLRPIIFGTPGIEYEQSPVPIGINGGKVDTMIAAMHSYLTGEIDLPVGMPSTETMSMPEDPPVSPVSTTYV